MFVLGQAVALLQEDDMRGRMPDQVSLADPASGTGIRRAEDSVYYHPSINPLGLPPPGKPQRYRTSVLALEGPAVSDSAAALPVPKPPPLPQGPAPQLALLPPPGTPETFGQQTSGAPVPAMHHSTKSTWCSSSLEKLL